MEGTKTIFETGWPLGRKTNNQAEFTALLYLLVDAYCNGIKKIHIFGDSKLAVNSANKTNKVTHMGIAPLAESIDKLLEQFTYYKI